MALYRLFLFKALHDIVAQFERHTTLTMDALYEVAHVMAGMMNAGIGVD